MDKTNVMRILDKAKIQYEGFEYSKELTEGILIAQAMNEDTRKVFKTLVTESNKKEYFVFVIPVAETLDLKAAAVVAGVKSICMIKQKELLPLTGYIHGGCSPVGMKKKFKTFIDKTAKESDVFYISAGRVGRQIKLSPIELSKFIDADFADITV